MLNALPTVYGRTLLRLTVATLSTYLKLAKLADSAVCRAPFGRLVRDGVLDTMLGRQENFEYVSQTTPIGYSPTR